MASVRRQLQLRTVQPDRGMALATCLFLLISSSVAFQLAPTSRHYDLSKPQISHSMSRMQVSQTSYNVPRKHGHPLMYRDRSASEEALTHHGFRNANGSNSARHVNAVPSSSTAGTSTTNPSASGASPFRSSVNLPLVRSICKSHLASFAVALAMTAAALFMSVGVNGLNLSTLHWNTGSDFYSLFDWKLTPGRMLEGVLGAAPLIAMGTMVESSANRRASQINFSITNTVISLFGRRRKPQQTSTTSASTKGVSSTMQVALISTGIATVSAVTQELIFRGLIPAVLVGWTHSVPVALIGQAFLFGLGQIQPNSSLDENSGFCAMHMSTALWYGVLYLVTGGDILPVMIAHILYDSHVLVEAWARINHQMEWTEKASPQKLSAEEEQDLERIRHEAGGSLAPQTLSFCRRFFYAFDYEHQGSLSVSDVKRAVAYAFLHDSNKPSEEQVETLFIEMIHHRRSRSTQGSRGSGEEADEAANSDRLRLPEFLRLLFALKSNTWQNQTA